MMVRTVISRLWIFVLKKLPQGKNFSKIQNKIANSKAFWIFYGTDTDIYLPCEWLQECESRKSNRLCLTHLLFGRKSHLFVMHSLLSLCFNGTMATFSFLPILFEPIMSVENCGATPPHVASMPSQKSFLAAKTSVSE